MAKKRSKTTLKSIHYFSEELIFKILSWTCVASLRRFRPVCKLWKSIISKPAFIEGHHTNSHKIPSILMITSTVDGAADKGGYSRRAATIVYSNSPEYSVNLPLLLPCDNLEFASSCNGIVCVYNFSGADIYLFNPLTRLSKRLRISDNQQPPVPVYGHQQQPYIFDAVFGFDCVSNDFKVIRIAYQRIVNSELLSVLAVELYSLNADSWREIQVHITLPNFIYYPCCPILISGPVVDGVLYLEGFNEIVTFDLHNELFGLIPFPSFMQRKKSNVLDFEGSVAVLVESVSDASVDKEISLWSMEAVSDEVFWKKIFTFDAGSEMDWVFLYMGANQFVGRRNKSNEILFYDYRKKETEYIGLPSKSFLVRLLKHNESFLSIKGFERVKEC